MTTSYTEAIDEIYTQILTPWNSDSAAIAGYVPDLHWRNLENVGTPDGSKFWARVSQQTVLEQQATLTTECGAPGQRRYQANGIVFVQIFCPKSVSQSDSIGRQLAVLARNAYRGKTTDSGIWFRNASINELDPENLYYRFNVVTDYQYDEIA